MVSNTDFIFHAFELHENILGVCALYSVTVLQLAAGGLTGY